jgi:hypothetical protein
MKNTFTYDWLKKWKTEIQLLSEKSSQSQSSLAIVRPTKKPTNFGPIRGVPKSGVWRRNVKKVLQTEGEEGRWGQSVWSIFLKF